MKIVNGFTRHACHVGDYRNYSSALPLFLKRNATAHLLSQVIASLKQQGLFRTRGVPSGNLMQQKRPRMKWYMSIPVINCSRGFEYDYYTQHISVSSPHNANNLITVKLFKPGCTLPRIIPSCTVLNARSLVKPDAAAALYTDLRTNKIDLCFVSETCLNNKLVSSLRCPDGDAILRKDRSDLRTGGGVVIISRNDWMIKRLDFQNDFGCVKLPQLVLNIM